MRQIIITYIFLVGAIASQPLWDTGHSSADTNKSKVIDIRSEKSQSLMDDTLYLVDGVVRISNSRDWRANSLKDDKHEILTINDNKLAYSKTYRGDGVNHEEELQIDSLLSMIGREEHDGFGISVAGVDDFNGDGYHDFVIGAPFHWGDVYLYFGGPEMDSIPDMEIHGDYSLGWPVASAGDVNMDGYGDIIVGEPVYGDQRQGAAYIFFGGSLMGSYLMLEGDQEELLLGAAVAPLGDINEDGYYSRLNYERRIPI